MPSKKLLILGATGPSGLQTVSHALSEGHEVIVYARSPDKLPEETRSNPKLKVFKGGLTDAAALSAAFAERPDAVISLLGPIVSDAFPPWKYDTIFIDGYRNINQAMRSHQVKRILVMGTVSIYTPQDKASIMRSFLVWVVYLLAHPAYRQVIGIMEFFQKEAQDLDWTIFRLGILGDGPLGEITAGYVGDGKTTKGISRAELAKWLVDEAVSENPGWVKGFPNVTSAGKQKL